LPGEIHALCGENGAGKSTLAAIAAGQVAPTTGRVERSGRVGLVHQHSELVERLRVWENVVLGREPRRGARIDVAAAREAVRALSHAHGLDVDPDAVVEALPVGIAQRVEILRELAREPRVLILDEPTAVLARNEIEALFATLRSLAAGGTAVLVITHKLDEVVAVAARVTVLRGGRVVMRAATQETSTVALARAMVGGDVAALAVRTPTVPRDGLDVRNLRAGVGAHAVAGVSFAVRCGEIVAVAGVEGNGQTGLVDAVAGAIPYVGAMSLGGRALVPGDPAARIAAGIRTIPQDRRREGLVLSWNLADNAILGDHGRVPFARRGLREARAADAFARDLVQRFDLRTRSIRARAATLSGGNQQKLVVGRALAHEPALIVAYQPTRGVDVAAAALVQSRLIEARNAGAAVLLAGFDLDELLALADRLFVMYRGAFVAEFARADFERGRIGAAMAGAA
jgi:simple sugar transport system ATP-binding protein